MSEESATAGDDELGIFVDGSGTFRVIIPKAWDPADGSGECPEFAFLAVAAVLRLAQPGEREFYRELAAWADTHLERHKKLNAPKFN